MPGYCHRHQGPIGSAISARPVGASAISASAIGPRAIGADRNSGGKSESTDADSARDPSTGRTSIESLPLARAGLGAGVRLGCRRATLENLRVDRSRELRIIFGSVFR